VNKRDTYQAVTDRIMAALEAGTVPWRRPWQTFGSPVNIRTGRRYRGINVLLLSLQDYSDPRWGTYKAISEAGGNVRRGEKSTRVVLWKPVKKRDAEGEDASYLLLRDYAVFNAEQAEGIEPLPEIEEREFTPIEQAERIVNGYVLVPGAGNPGPPMLFGGDRAYYSPFEDTVKTPRAELFESDEAFYSTLFHELVHSTGHKKRLGRIEPAIFGSDPYAKEELVAEVGASFLCGIAGLAAAGDEQSAAYIAGWLKALSSDRRLVVQAAAQAQKAVDMIVGETFTDTEKQKEGELELVA
jgi:antirestriction protein ArdC